MQFKPTPKKKFFQRLYHKLKLEFSNRQMERDYRTLKEENMTKDFKGCLIFLFVFNLVSAIFSIVRHLWTDLYYSGITLVVVAFLFCFHKFLKKYIQIVTLVIILSYNISRLFQLNTIFETSTKSRLFLSGYALASLLNVLSMRLLKVSQKAFAIIIILALRFLIVSLYVEPGTFLVRSFIMQSMIDAYIIYTIYSQEKNFRKIYLDFVQKKEELLKFKELLAESLPQGLVIVEQASNHLLFSNKAFENTFTNDNDSDSLSSILTDRSLKVTLESLLVEKSTIRETGEGDSALNFLNDLNFPASLGEILEKLSLTDYLSQKTISLAASITRKQNRRLFEVTVTKVKWDSQDAIAVLFNDITYQEKMIALKLANINKDKVIATVSHELRTPLNGIIGILDIAENKVDNSEVAEYLSLCKDNAQLLLSLVNSILDLQQITAGKLKLNPENIDIRKVINSICQLFYFQCKQKNIKLECEVHAEVPRCIVADENRLKQILINLVGNAIKFTSKGGIKIEVAENSTRLDSLRISVADTGIGIKQEDQKCLFKMYSKIEDGESVNKNGVGLGLTISNALVTLINGDIDNQDSQGIKVESEYGAGTRFYFEIPKHLQPKKQIPAIGSTQSLETKLILTRPETEGTKPTSARKVSVSGEQKADEESIEGNQQEDYEEFYLAPSSNRPLKMESCDFLSRINTCKLGSSEEEHNVGTPNDERLHTTNTLTKMNKQDTVINLNTSIRIIDVLIVDDNPFNLLVAKNLMQEFGCKIKTALGGQEAIDIVKTSLSEGTMFKVIFMDCQMPIMDGFETTKILRELMENEEIPEVPIYGWTANNSEEDVKRCYDAGMVGHLPKPASKSDLSKVISRL